MGWPQIPSDLNSLSAEALRALAKDVKAEAIRRLGTGSLTKDELAEITEWSGPRRQSLLDLADQKDALASEAAAALARLSAEEKDPSKAESAPRETRQDDNEHKGDADKVSDNTQERRKTTDGLDSQKDDADKAGVTQRGKVGDKTEQHPDAVKELTDNGAPIKTTFGATSTPEKEAPAKRRMPLEYLRAVDGVAGKKADDSFESWAELSMSVLDKAKSLRGNTSEQFEVARVYANYAPERVLGEDITFNLRKFEPDELTAAFCAPATPYYGISCMNTNRRPVFNSLPQFQAPRMKVSIMPSPTLADINAGFGVWTDTDDDDSAAVKLCETITCGSPTEYKMYGVWRCLTVKNLMMMSYPELVEAWLNRLAAAQARLAEQRLLNAMATSAVEINAPALGFGGATTITRALLQYFALYQESQRWDVDGGFEAWAPRWVLTGIKLDLLSRSGQGTSIPSIPTDGQVEQMFSNAGINIHWFIDTPAWAVAPAAIATSSNLNAVPATVDILVAPRGKFALMDRGNLSIGVTGNNLYRDNASNARNEFTFFFENFEGIVNTNTCPAHILQIPVCWNGAERALQPVNCLGVAV